MHTVQWDTIDSISSMGSGIYLDLHVPGAEHYLAEGIWHHNTGKSRTLLFLLAIRAQRYSGSRHIMLRKFRSSLTQSALVTWRTEVQPELLGFKHDRGNFQYVHTNGSVVVYAGLDDPGKVMSAEYDTAYIQEETEIDEGSYEMVLSRLRHGAMPYQQLTGDCNPGPSQHWLKQRWERGALRALQSLHKDNPALWDAERQEWTERGRQYMGILDRLTGVRRYRLRDGLWVSAEGMVYEDVWQRALHIIPRFRIPKEWPRYWSIDFGYTNPMCVQFWAQDPDGRLYRYREFYRTNMLVEDMARDVMDLCTRENEPIPRAIICDHDAEDRMTFERHAVWPGTTNHLRTTPAYKAIGQGIQAVAARFRVAGDGKPRLFLLENSLVKPDPTLLEKHLPLCTDDEIEAYVWNTNNGRKKGEEPEDKDNHGLDSARYLVCHIDLIGKERREFRTGAAGTPSGAYTYKVR